jgi:glycosyltransferase involved in cell wall biosynthesis
LLGMRVLITGYNCSPYRGSEFSGTWRWAWHLAGQHEVWVLTSKHGWEETQQFLREHPNPYLHFERVDPPPILDPRPPWGAIPHYLAWQRLVLRRAAELQQRYRIEVVHHVSWGSVSSAPELWRLPAPFVWGPVGGGQTTPRGFLKYYGAQQAMELLRRPRIRLLPFRPNLKNAARQSALILATNRESQRVLEQAGARRLQTFLDSGIPPELVPKRPILRPEKRGVTVLWAGKLEPRKALPLALEALREVKDRRVRLLVAGDGPLRSAWELLARDVNLADRVTFLGAVPWTQMFALYAQADIFLFTSLRDSFGMQVLEAMSQALPIVTLNHQGAATFLPDDAGVRVPVRSPQITVGALAAAVEILSSSCELRRRIGERAWAFARRENWDARARRMTELYGSLLCRPQVQEKEPGLLAAHD